MINDLLGQLAAPPVGRNRRISSNEQPAWNDGNFDMTWLLPGQSIEMPVLDGPGLITHIWMTSHSGGVHELNALSLRIFWDGRSEPGVEVPLGEFFAVGQGSPAPVESIPVQVSPTGSLSCFWRMPFHQSARIIVTNDNPDRSTGLYWQVDWTQLDTLPPETALFHARYRQQYPATMGQDYLIADIKGQGKYVGTVLAVTLAQDGWFGEGDDFFYIDGEEVPSLQGTGSEDYFNDAWGFRPRSGPWFGQPRWQGDRAGDSGVCYRWHVADPVHFQDSLKVTIEHKGNRAESEDGWYIERPDFLSSVAFWYQTGEPSPAPPLPGWRARRTPWEVRHLLRSYRSVQITGGPPVEIGTQGFFGGRPALAWPEAPVDASLEIPFTVDRSERWAVRLTAFTHPEYGNYDIRLDGHPVATDMSFSSQEAGEIDLSLGVHELSGGDHSLTFSSRLSTGHTSGGLAVEMLRLLALPPEAVRVPKTHNEAHFIRLGIGRALYAFRLAFYTLPESLEELVAAKIMPARYLTDENGAALECRRDGTRVIVQSTAPGGWRHSWQGLDARR